MTNEEEEEILANYGPEMVAEIRRTEHVPDRDELRAMLVRYFVGPIVEEHIDRVLTELENRSGFGDRLALHQQFERIYFRGFAWREEFSIHQTPSDADLMLMLAHQLWGGNGFRQRQLGETLKSPQPKLYCPSYIVGTWEQLEPARPSLAPLLWHFEPDGVLRTTSPDAPEKYNRWCVHQKDKFLQRTNEIVLQTETFLGAWGIRALDQRDGVMTGHHLGHMEETEFRFRRVGSTP